MGPQRLPERQKSRVRFGEFELDRGNGELLRKGRKVHIQSQPLRVLELLLGRSGELVTREEIRQAIWPDDTFVEFDAGVGNAIRKIRQALGDDADNSRFVQTVPRQGFRFIAPVHFVVPATQAQPELELRLMPVAVPAPPALPDPVRRLRMVLAAAVLVIVGLIIVQFGALLPGSGKALRPNDALITQTQLFTTYPGDEEHPAFSPDGNFIAFDWDGGKPEDFVSIWVQNVSAHSPSRLSSGLASELCPAWSPDGWQVAFIRRRGEGRAGIYSVPVLGTGERKWAEFSLADLGHPKLSWSPDGKWFAVPERVENGSPSYILLISTENGARRRLTTPPAGSLGDAEPAFSPDSRLIAFRRTLSIAVEDLYVVPVAGGEPRRLTFDHVGLPGLAWAADGKSLIVSSHRAGATRSLWRIPVYGGAPVRLTPSTVDATSPAIAPKGGRMAFDSSIFDVNIWELRLDGKRPAAPLINSNVLDSGPRYSPDGSRIAFRSTRSGHDEIWTVHADGASPRQLTNVNGSLTGSPRWSPDGQSLLYESRVNGNGDVFLISAEGGKPTLLTSDRTNEILPSWSHDGQFFYFASDRGGGWQIWRQPLAGGPAVQVTVNGGFAAFESPDGQWLYYSKGGKTQGIWRVPTALPGTAERLVLDAVPGSMWGNWAVGAKGIYYIDRQKAPMHSTIKYYAFETQATQVLGELTNVPAVNDSGLAVSPDESRILFAQVDRYGSDIFLVNGFQ
jgi:Tol biopolymer transport system component/DNA-binding winged helix-turn-helix (wHTH) protein